MKLVCDRGVGVFARRDFLLQIVDPRIDALECGAHGGSIELLVELKELSCVLICELRCKARVRICDREREDICVGGGGHRSVAEEDLV